MAIAAHHEDNMEKWVGSRPAHNGEQIVEMAAINNAITAVYTVPADKILLLYEATASLMNYSGAVLSLYAYIEDDVPAQWYSLIAQRLKDDTSFTVHCHFDPPMELPEAYAIIGQSGNATARVTLSCHGILIDV